MPTFVVDPADLEPDDVSEADLQSSAAARRNLDVLQRWAGQAPAGRSRRVHLHFFSRPLALTGDRRVAGVRIERTRFAPDGTLAGTGAELDLPAQLVVRAVGYRSLPLPGLPFDEAAGVVPHEAGRVHRGGVPEVGSYVAGWAKRGPTGVIGTNKHDARETVRTLLADVPSLRPGSGPRPRRPAPAARRARRPGRHLGRLARDRAGRDRPRPGAGARARQDQPPRRDAPAGGRGLRFDAQKASALPDTCSLRRARS